MTTQHPQIKNSKYWKNYDKETISMLIKPCNCVELFKYEIKEVNETTAGVDGNDLRAVWLECSIQNLGDEKVRSILKAYLSSDVNRGNLHKESIWTGINWRKFLVKWLNSNALKDFI